MTMAIKALREAKGYSRSELAQLMSVSRPAVVKWENGKSSPRSDKLPLLAQILGVEVGPALYPTHQLKGGVPWHILPPCHGWG